MEENMSGKWKEKKKKNTKKIGVKKKRNMKKRTQKTKKHPVKKKKRLAYFITGCFYYFFQELEPSITGGLLVAVACWH